MRCLLASLPVLLGFALLLPAAAPPVPPERAADQLDYLFLGSDRPVLLRLHVRVGDKPYDARWNAFMDKLFAWFDKDGDGSLSKAEAERLPVPAGLTFIAQGVRAWVRDQPIALAALDTNKDGKVSKEEFRAYYRRNGFSEAAFVAQNFEAAQAKQVNDALLRRLDPKGDGKLTVAKVAGLEGKLRVLDRNDDEIITRAELDNDAGARGAYGTFIDVDGFGRVERPVVTDNSLHPIQPRQEDGLVKTLLTRYDRDKDGKLSRKEIGMDAAAFGRLDADKDGLLDPAELKAYVAAGRPDVVLRLQLGSPPPGKGLLDFGSLLHPRLLLVNQKTIDPALKKRYRRGPGDSCAIELGDTRMSLQMPRSLGSGWIDLRPHFLQLYDQAAGKKSHVTRADLKAPSFQILLANYSQADKNADGKLTRVELGEWFDLMAGARDTVLMLTSNDLGRSLFDVLDADGDGRLSLREMRSAWKRLGPLARGGAVGPNDLLRTLRIDINFGTGQSFAPNQFDLMMRVGSLPEVKRLDAPLWFRKMDKNNDGDISPREWLGSDEDFKAIDADGDGLISADEAVAFDKKKKSQDKE